MVESICTSLYPGLNFITLTLTQVVSEDMKEDVSMSVDEAIAYGNVNIVGKKSLMATAILTVCGFHKCLRIVLCVERFHL
jgi:hypothetical protein